MTLGFGWALLDARTGYNRPHSHIAHQISLALESPCEIRSEHPLQLEQGQAALIPAGTENFLVPAGVAVRAIYVDPLFRGMKSYSGASARTLGIRRGSGAWGGKMR